MDALTILQEHENIFDIINNALLWFLRPLGWLILKGIAFLVSGVESAVDFLFNNLNFFQSPDVKEFMKGMRPIVWALLSIGIILIGYQIMFNRHKDKSKIPINLIVFIMIMTGLPTFMGQLADVTGSSINMLMGESVSITETLIADSVTDLKYLDVNDFSEESISSKNNLSPDSILNIDTAELMLPQDCENKEVFENKIKLGTNGEKTLSKLEEFSVFMIGRIDFLTPYYYRYNVDWLTLLVALIALLLSFTFSGLKIAKIIFEIAYAGIYTTLTAPLDMSTGQRTKRCLQEIMSLFLVLISIALMFRLYIMGVAWANSIASGMPLIFLLMGMSWALIDGPNLVQILLGIDAGLSSAARTILATYSAVKGASAIGRGVTDGIKSGAKGVGKVVSGAATAGSFASGFASEGFKGLFSKSEADSKQDDKNTPVGIYGGRQIESPNQSKLNSGSADAMNDSKETTPTNPRHSDQNTSGSLYREKESPNLREENSPISSTPDVGDSSRHIEEKGMPNSREESLSTSSAPDVSDKSERIGEKESDTTQGLHDKEPLVAGQATQSRTATEQKNNSIDSSMQVENSTDGQRHSRDENTTIHDLAKAKLGELPFKQMSARLEKSYQVGCNTARYHMDKSTTNQEPRKIYSSPDVSSFGKAKQSPTTNEPSSKKGLSSPDVPTKKRSLFSKNKKK